MYVCIEKNPCTFAVKLTTLGNLAIKCTPVRKATIGNPNM